LDLRDRLEHRDHDADDQAGQQKRHRDLERRRERARREVDCGVLVHRKDSTRPPSTRCHPSASTNKRILNGRLPRTGGNIIMPIDISVELTTMSITRNGRKMRKPIWNAVFSSEMTNAGIST